MMIIADRARVAVLAFAVVAFVSACAKQKVQEGLATLIGQPESVAFAKLGYPDGQQTFGNTKVYTWVNRKSMSCLTYDTTNYSGYVGSTSFSGTSGGLREQTAHGSCKIKITVENEIIKS